MFDLGLLALRGTGFLLAFTFGIQKAGWYLMAFHANKPSPVVLRRSASALFAVLCEPVLLLIRLPAPSATVRFTSTSEDLATPR